MTYLIPIRKMGKQALACLLVKAVWLMIGAPAAAQSLAFTNTPGPAVQTEQAQVPLKEALQVVERRFQVVLGYRNNLVENLITASGAWQSQQDLDATLQVLLEPFSLTYKKIGEKAFVLKKKREAGKEDDTPAVPAASRAPAGTADAKQIINGRVTDEKNQGIPGVNVLLKGTTTGATTNAESTYTLNVPDGNGTLVFSYIGYTTQEVPINNRTTIDVNLAADIESLSEVVVVGYGTQKKVNLTGSVSAIEGEAIARRPVTLSSQALQGVAPGVTVIQNFGAPGDNGGTIRIRGIGTLGNNNPLVLIDNVEGNLNDIDPNNIESISVLKDAASAAIYGSRAANGVVLITTKRGARKEAISVNYRGYAGVQTPTNLPELVRGVDYLTLTNESVTNEGKTPIFTDAFIEAYRANVGTSDEYPDTDWYKASMKKRAFQQQHSLSISGGSEKMSAQASFTYLNQQGLLDNTSYKRYGLRLNTDIYINPKLRAGIDVFATQGDQVKPSGLTATQDGVYEIFRMINEIPPIFPVKLASGAWGVGWNGANPLAMSQVSGTTDLISSRIQLNLNASYAFNDYLKLDVIYAPKYLSEFGKSFAKQYAFERLGSAPQTYPAKSEFQQNYSKTFETNARGLLTFKKDLGIHSVQAIAGVEYISNRFDYFNAYRENFPLQDYEVINAGSDVNKNNAGSAEEWALFSGFGRVNYTLLDKYLLEANIRYDGSSRFAQGNKFGVFPSFSAGWRVSQENFMKSLGFLSDLKLRASWGQLGNQNIGIYPFASVITFAGQNYSFNNKIVNGAALLDLSNRNISWETTEMWNAGVDFGFFQDKLSGSFDYYLRNTKDILLLLPVPLSTGLNPAYQNAGQVRNKGWDLLLSHRNNLGGFTYRLEFVLSDVSNQVTDLKGTGPFIQGRTIIREGDEINAFYGYQSDGLFQSVEEIKNHATQFGNVAPGDIRYVDQNNDGLINSADRRVIGSSIPRYTYSLNANAGLKGFDLAVFFQGVGKKEGYVYRNESIGYSGTYYTWQLDRWTLENPDASLPRTTSIEPNNLQTTDFYIKDASYLRLKTVQLGYALPKSWAAKARLQNARVFLTGDNIFTATSYYKGFDPEAPSAAGHFFYPNTKVFIAGVDLQF